MLAQIRPSADILIADDGFPGDTRAVVPAVRAPKASYIEGPHRSHAQILDYPTNVG